jgi:hypothetical protein
VLWQHCRPHSSDQKSHGGKVGRLRKLWRRYLTFASPSSGFWAYPSLHSYSSLSISIFMQVLHRFYQQFSIPITRLMSRRCNYYRVILPSIIAIPYLPGLRLYLRHLLFLNAFLALSAFLGYFRSGVLTPPPPHRPFRDVVTAGHLVSLRFMQGLRFIDLSHPTTSSTKSIHLPRP